MVAALDAVDDLAVEPRQNAGQDRDAVPVDADVEAGKVRARPEEPPAQLDLVVGKDMNGLEAAAGKRLEPTRFTGD